MALTEIAGYKLGKILIEGKTKAVYELPQNEGLCLLLNKDRITAGDGIKKHDLAGKAEISNATNGKVFGILNEAGLKTAYVAAAGPTAFIAKNCEMIPIEWVARRLATGSYCRRYPSVSEGTRFAPPKQETFFKDDANHDPQWTEEEIIAAKFTFNGLTIGRAEVDIMRESTILVFEVLEKAWKTRNCALIDMKIEFGVDQKGELILADVIDSDSWRLWPSGDKRLMVDKQVYRDLKTVTAEALDQVKNNFSWISDQMNNIIPPNDHLVVVLMGSPSDTDHCEKIAKYGRDLGLNVELRVCSAHKSTQDTLNIVREYESVHNHLVFIAVAGRSNGLGPVLSGNTAFPVINCPPVNANNVSTDIWSSLNVPSGLGCGTVLYPESAALNAAQALGLSNYIIWSKLRVRQLNTLIALKEADKLVQGIRYAKLHN